MILKKLKCYILKKTHSFKYIFHSNSEIENCGFDQHILLNTGYILIAYIYSYQYAKNKFSQFPFFFIQPLLYLKKVAYPFLLYKIENLKWRNPGIQNNHKKWAQLSVSDYILLFFRRSHFLDYECCALSSPRVKIEYVIYQSVCISQKRKIQQFLSLSFNFACKEIESSIRSLIYVRREM